MDVDTDDIDIDAVIRLQKGWNKGLGRCMLEVLLRYRLWGWRTSCSKFLASTEDPRVRS